LGNKETAENSPFCPGGRLVSSTAKRLGHSDANFATFINVFLCSVCLRCADTSSFDLDELRDVTSLLRAIGLSIANVMAIGLAMNTLLPAVGFMTLISIVPLLMTFSLEICILCGMCYEFDKYVLKTESPDIFNE
jgi:uncharacterized membrane protein